MLSKKASTKVVLGVGFSFLLIVIIISASVKKELPAVSSSHSTKSEKVAKTKKTVTEDDFFRNLKGYLDDALIEAVVRTETLYVLSQANVRSGPGKEYKVIDRLVGAQTVEVYKNDSTKWKALTDDKGHIYHTLLGTKKQYEEAYWKSLNRSIRKFKNLGLITDIIEVDESHHKLYVDYNLWTYQLTQQARQNIMMNYALGMSMLIENKYLKRHVGCSIMDSRTGQRLISYQRSSNKFF